VADLFHSIRKAGNAAVHHGQGDPTLHCWLSDGDVLIQRTNTLELVGSTAIYRGPSRTYVYPDLMMRVRIVDDAQRFLVWRYMNGRVARMYLQARATGTAGNIPKVNGATVRCVIVPVPPPLERSLLVRQLEASLTGAEAIEGAVKAALSRHASIDQSILARAFRGELVGSTV
jgi:type I restriction enzyme S subunit